MQKRTAWGLCSLAFCGGVALAFALRGSAGAHDDPALHGQALDGQVLDSASLEAGIREFEAGRFEQARSIFEQVLQARPDEPQAHYWLGCALGREAQQANRLRQAVLAPRIREHFERAVELDGDYLAARKRLVDFYTEAPSFMGGGLDKARAQVAEIERIDAHEGRLARDLVERAAARQ